MIWLELKSVESITQTPDPRFASGNALDVDTTVTNKSDTHDISDGVMGDSSGPAIGRLKILVRLFVDKDANASSCYRPEQPLAISYPPFSASRLLHAVADCTDHFLNPIFELMYDVMGMLNWEMPLRTFAYFYFWIMLVVYIEWGMVRRAMMYVFCVCVCMSVYIMLPVSTCGHVCVYCVRVCE